MNHKQINELQEYDSFHGTYLHDKRGVWFELKEPYIYEIDFLKGDSPLFPKGLKIQFRYLTLSGLEFNLDSPVEPFGSTAIFGRSRLLKMKLKEIMVVDEVS